MSIVLLATPASTDDNSGQGHVNLYVRLGRPVLACECFLSFIHRGDIRRAGAGWLVRWNNVQLTQY